MSTGLVVQFQALYNDLDEYMRARLGCPPGVPHTQLLEQMATRDAFFREKLTRLEAFARLRNALVHNPDVGRFDPIAEPHPGVVTEYESAIRYVRDPPRALSLAVPRSKLFTVSWKMPVAEVLRTMRLNAFSLAPVVEDERLEAVFLDCTLMRAFLESEGFARGVPRVMRDLQPFIDHHGDQLGSIEYLPPTATVRDAEDRFATAFAATTALRAILLTTDGSPSGNLLGLITGYDLLGVPR